MILGDQISSDSKDMKKQYPPALTNHHTNTFVYTVHLMFTTLKLHSLVHWCKTMTQAIDKTIQAVCIITPYKVVRTQS